jgi:hypothetical protein
MTTTDFAQSTSTLTPYSGDLQSQLKANTESLVQSQSNTDSESSTKKDKIAAGGGQLMEPPITKNPWPEHSNLVATKETPQTLTLTSQETNQRNKRNAPLLHWLNSFPHTLPDPSSIPLTDYLRWLLECHKSQRLPLSLQQAHWAELLELEYPPEQEVGRPTYLEISLEEEDDLEEDHLMEQDRLEVEDLLTMDVTDLQRPPLERTPEQKLWDFKTRAQQYARDRESCDDVRISYLEFLETEAEDDLALARMIAG